MAYIDQQDIFDRTSGGLDIILSCYPQAKAVLNGSAKHFRIRSDEHGSLHNSGWFYFYA